MRNQRIFLLLILATLGGCGLKLCQEWNFISARNKVSSRVVSKQTMMDIKVGSSFNAVKAMIGSVGTLEFNVQHNDETFSLISCRGPDIEGENFGLLFHKDFLQKVIKTPFPIAQDYYQGPAASSTRPWDLAVQRQMNRAIAAPALDRSQIASDMQPFDTRPYESWGVVPVAFLFIPSMFIPSPHFFLTSKGAEALTRTLELQRRYNGLRVSLGMSRGQIEEILGKPLNTFAGGNAETVLIYGQAQELYIDPLPRFSGLAIVIASDNRVCAVYGGWFFTNGWKG